MAVEFYELDQRVHQKLAVRSQTPEQHKQWYGKASQIAEYVSSWGMVRFWALSRSQVARGGRNAENQDGEGGENYFAWKVAREILCELVGNDLNIQEDLITDVFQQRFYALSFNQQVLLTDLLLEIAETIQFWSVRLKEALDEKRAA